MFQELFDIVRPAPIQEVRYVYWGGPVEEEQINYCSHEKLPVKFFHWFILLAMFCSFVHFCFVICSLCDRDRRTLKERFDELMAITKHQLLRASNTTEYGEIYYRSIVMQLADICWYLWMAVFCLCFYWMFIAPCKLPLRVVTALISGSGCMAFQNKVSHFLRLLLSECTLQLVPVNTAVVRCSHSVPATLQLKFFTPEIVTKSVVEFLQYEPNRKQIEPWVHSYDFFMEWLPLLLKSVMGLGSFGGVFYAMAKSFFAS
jgi:hypothetical protein